MVSLPTSLPNFIALAHLEAELGRFEFCQWKNCGKIPFNRAFGTLSGIWGEGNRKLPHPSLRSSEDGWRNSSHMFTCRWCSWPGAERGEMTLTVEKAIWVKLPLFDCRRRFPSLHLAKEHQRRSSTHQTSFSIHPHSLSGRGGVVFIFPPPSGLKERSDMVLDHNFFTIALAQLPDELGQWNL